MSLGISSYLRWYFWTAYSVTFRYSSSSSGVLDHKRTCIMWWSTCFWVPPKNLVKTSCSGASVHFRHGFLILYIQKLPKFLPHSYSSWYYSADFVIAYGIHCRSMDAFPKTFCTQENSHGGISLHLFDLLYSFCGVWLTKRWFFFCLIEVSRSNLRRSRYFWGGSGCRARLS